MKNDNSALRYNFNNLIVAFLATFLTYQISAQEFSFQISWKKPIKKEIDGKTFDVPVVNDGEFQGALPIFSAKNKINFKNGTWSLMDLSYSPAEYNESIYLDKVARTDLIDKKIDGVFTSDLGKYFFMVSCIPFFKENGAWMKINSFKIKITPSGTFSLKPKSYVTSSVLGSGDWYKIAVTQNGIYKLDKSFLKNIGVAVETLNPSDLNIYGNADGVLSEKNNGAYFDDLTKNAIQFVGNTDAVFDDGEYFLFYGAGPNRWNYNSGQGFSRQMHIYSEKNHYFIRIDGTDVPLRVQDLTVPSTPNQFVTSYSYYTIHENESVNLVQGGQRWYGELFSGTLSQNFDFSIPNLVTTVPVQVEYAVANNGSLGGNSFSVNHNGSQVGFISLSSTGLDYARNVTSFSFSPMSDNFTLNYVFNRINASVKAYLDYIEVTCRRNLVFTGNGFEFRDLNSVGSGNVSQFTISNVGAGYLVWDITNKRQAKNAPGTFVGSNFQFTQATDTLREFIVFNPQTALIPSFVTKIENQNLHALGQYDLIVVAPTQFVAYAQQLVDLHQAYDGLTGIAVDVQEIYNEYSSGNQDATAIRRFVKMFYDRANGNPDDQPKYLTFFGDATYDPKNRVAGNNYLLPTYEYLYSEDHISALVTDDYFGLLDDNEGIGDAELMDISVGRLLISNTNHAVSQLKKIEHYLKNGINSALTASNPNSCCIDEAANSFGDWKLVYTIVTDDDDDATATTSFVALDAEGASNVVQSLYHEMNAEKLYSDAFTQVSTTGGQRYPEVYDAISRRVDRGTQILNYIGHGGEVGAAEERIITIPQINAFTNLNRLGLFVTATCEFTKFDDPSRESIGELISLHPTGGAISLMTTTRSIFVSVNSTIIQSLYSHVFERDSDYKSLSFGEIMRRTKNSSGTSTNRRCFTLIGDPALRISIPQWKIVTDSINHMVPAMVDTVRALSKMSIAGHLEDNLGNVLTGFNGVLTPTIFDKPQVQQTLQNDPASPLVYFKTQKNALYKGRATVQNGKFNFEFIVPKDIDYNFGRGKISYYADNKNIDASGWDTSFVVGGINPNPDLDNVGPEIALYLNDNSFVQGGTTSANPLLVIEASDDFGINTVGNGIGHDIIAILDGNSGNPIILNEFYRANLDSYKSGKVQYPLKGLSVGRHTLEVKVWDVNNNSSSLKLEFVVAEEDEVALDHVLNYPNPFTTHTTFFFDHNQSCASFETQVQIYTVSGRLVKTINQTVPTNGFHVDGINWDGTDDFGDRLATGVYVYRISVTMPDGKKAEKLEKLVLLK